MGTKKHNKKSRFFGRSRYKIAKNRPILIKLVISKIEKNLQFSILPDFLEYLCVRKWPRKVTGHFSMELISHMWV